MPTPTPTMASTAPCRKTSCTTRPGCPPSPIRIPISRAPREPSSASSPDNHTPQAAGLRNADHGNALVPRPPLVVGISAFLAALVAHRIFLAKVFLDESVIHDHPGPGQSGGSSVVRRSHLESRSMEYAPGEK